MPWISLTSRFVGDNSNKGGEGGGKEAGEES
jgi:hypothetical protein